MASLNVTYVPDITAPTSLPQIADTAVREVNGREAGRCGAVRRNKRADRRCWKATKMRPAQEHCNAGYAPNDKPRWRREVPSDCAGRRPTLLGREVWPAQIPVVQRRAMGLEKERAKQPLVPPSIHIQAGIGGKETGRLSSAVIIWARRLCRSETTWCPLPDSNRHDACASRDFKSRMSTNSIKRAACGRRLEPDSGLRADRQLPSDLTPPVHPRSARRRGF